MKRLLTIALLCACCGPTALAASSSPNIVIFYADDMGLGDVGAYGCPDIKTPNLDALAARGIRFTNYYSAAPVCSPSRAALLTGRAPARAGVPGNVSSQPGHAGMPTDEVTLAEIAKTRGYATALIGKWHLGFSDDTRPNVQGFDEFFGHHAGCIDYYSHMFYWRAPHHHDLYRNRTEVHEEGKYMTELITREATRFLDSHKDKPFLLYIPFNAPHYPLQAPEQYRKMYADLPFPRSGYAPLVGALDEAIGHVLARLDALDLTKKTIVFFMSDNGISYEVRNNYGGGNSGGYRDGKVSLFDGGIHMPAIVSWPGKLPENETRDQLAIAMDVLPTIAAAIGADLPDNRVYDGIDWMPFLKNAAAPGHDILCWSFQGQRAVRQGKWKLVKDGIVHPGQAKGKRLEGEDALFLTDMEADKAETTNLAAKHPDIVRQLLDTHTTWEKGIADELKALGRTQDKNK